MCYKGREVINMAQTGKKSNFWQTEKGAASLETIIRTYSDPLVRFAYCYVGSASVAEELMEDALADVLFRDKQFKDESHFKAYLYKTLRHRCLNYLRFHRKLVPLEDVESVLCAGDLEADAIKKERDRTVYTCLQELPLQYRQVLTLSYFDGFSVEEIGEIMSRSRKQVYNLLARAKTSLRTLLEKVGITYEDI